MGKFKLLQALLIRAGIPATGGIFQPIPFASVFAVASASAVAVDPQVSLRHDFHRRKSMGKGFKKGFGWGGLHYANRGLNEK